MFDFKIISMNTTDGLVLNGHCQTYYMPTPEYMISLKDRHGTRPAETSAVGNQFTAELDAFEDSEILIKFKGFPTVSTATYIRDGKISYVDEYVTEPQDNRLDGAVLKAYTAKYDTFVYQKDEALLWLIGYDIDDTTEIICHIDTNEKERLPEKRRQSGFDNLGFRPTINELESIDQYRVFIKEIPLEYNVTGVTVGFNEHGVITWSEKFRIEAVDNS